MPTEKPIIGTGRLEAFSDGVIAIVITIMVLELKVPHGTGDQDASFAALRPLIPVMLSYVLSFIYVGIYWVNHHHLLQATPAVSAGILWANLHLLFWQSLVPFVTSWMGQNHFAPVPTALYGGVLLMSGVAFVLLKRAILANVGSDSEIARALEGDWKGQWSIVLYAAAIGLSFVAVWASDILYVVVAALWFVPDKRIEKAIADTDA